eukprot:scaffold1130_cov195-Pinguiococcus_pyrenoidosus.AAC.29
MHVAQPGPLSGKHVSLTNLFRSLAAAAARSSSRAVTEDGVSDPRPERRPSTSVGRSVGVGLRIALPTDGDGEVHPKAPERLPTPLHANFDSRQRERSGPYGTCLLEETNEEA